MSKSNNVILLMLGGLASCYIRPKSS